MSDDGSPAKHGRLSYTLSSKERAYVESGDPGSYREKEMDDRVQKKVERLGQRVDHLLLDIQLLSDEGYLGGEYWGETWIDFIGFDDTGRRPENDRRAISEFKDTDREPDHDDILEACQVSPAPGRARPTSSPEQLAASIGVMLDRLMRYPEGIDQKQMAMEIGWGLADGFLRGDKAAFAMMGDGRRDLKEQFIEYQQTRLEREAELDDERLQEYEGSRDRSKEWVHARHEMADCIRDVLLDADLPIQSEFGEKLKYRDEGTVETLNESLSEYHGETTEDGIFADEVVDLLIDRLVDEPDDIDDYPFITNKPGTTGQWILFQGQYGPLKEFDPGAVVEKDDVLTVVSENHLVAKGKLNVLVNKDMEAVEDAHWKSVEATEVLKRIVGQDGQVRSVDIAEEIGDRYDKAAVTKLCTDLAGREFERAILRGDINNNWNLTPYGELVVKEASGYFFGPLSAHQSGAEEAALIDAAATQVGVKDWRYSQND